MSSILFLSTDGLTDQLGQSQILPYLVGLRKKGHAVTIISLEKSQRKSAIDSTRQYVNDRGITWLPLSYHNRPPVVATVWDLFSMYRLSREVLKKTKIDIVHCRSYLAALIGLRLKYKSTIKLLFDTRGFWIDERIEGKIWNPGNLIYAMIIRWLRVREKHLYKNADAVVMLTEASKKYLRTHSALNPTTSLLEVIPCCTDEKLFFTVPETDPNRKTISTQLGIAEQDMIVLYHGSLGTWYKIDELIDFFAVLTKKFPAARLLIVTRDATDSLHAKWKSTGLTSDKLLVFSATRTQMPTVLSLAHLAVFFITPSFSKMASSPTKLGELCMMHIPFVTNSGVGDGDELIAQTTNGMIVREFTQQAYQHAVDQIDSGFLTQQADRALLEYFSLERGVEKYHSLYLTLTERVGYI